jgi:hypothetical protein
MSSTMGTGNVYSDYVHSHGEGVCELCREPLPKCVHGYAVPVIETCPDGCMHANTPAEARTGVSDRTAAALDDLRALRGFVKHGPDTVREASDMLLALDRIERALRAART